MISFIMFTQNSLFFLKPAVEMSQSILDSERGRDSPIHGDCLPNSLFITAG